MSKYWFFERKGRPTANESRICDKITSAMNRGLFEKHELEEYIANYGKSFSEEDLTEMYENLSGQDLQGNKIEFEDDNYDDDGIEDAVEDYIDDSNSEKIENPINFNPFEEPVIERSYTQGYVNSQKDEDLFDEEDLKMPSDGESINDIPEEEQDIPEPDYANTQYQQEEEDDDDYDDDDYDEEDGGGKLGGDNLQDLTPAQKRKSAEKTAEALLNLYCQFTPLPFKNWAGFKDHKIQKMAFEDRLDLKMPLENGITVEDYINGQNEQVEEIFKVSDETREEIKDPLIDVLLEQELALTPTQRLMLAVGSHLVTMSFSAYQLAQNNKVALETFERYHQTTKKQNTNAPFPTEQAVKNKAKKKDNLSKVEQEAVEKFMREMNGDDDEEIIDSEHDPNVTVSEDYDDE
jgi:hypothetical protein